MNGHSRWNALGASRMRSCRGVEEEIMARIKLLK
jgi:hypothetical protein